MSLHPDVCEGSGSAATGEGLGLFLGPAVAGMAGGAGADAALDREEATARLKHPLGLAEARVYVGPVMHGGQ